MILNFGTGSDWQGKSYTNVGWNLFEGFSDEDKTLVKWHLTKWEFGGGGVSAFQAPSFVIDNLLNQLPIILSSFLDGLQGENTAFEIIADGLGAHIHRTRPEKKKKKKLLSKRGSQRSRGSVFSGK